MPLSAATKLGPYEIIAPIGAGGMGEVYRAHDTKLERDVAIKVLPPAVAQDPERLARFEREAKILASLKGRLPLATARHTMNDVIAVTKSNAPAIAHGSQVRLASLPVAGELDELHRRTSQAK
jgi:serine/threonine protein kinase